MDGPRYSNRKNVFDGHSFLINNNSGGLTGRLSSLKCDADTTFGRVRREIELKEERGMMRRTSFFQELLHVMTSSPNPHQYGKDTKFHYRFGVFEEGGNGEIPTLVPLEEEAEGAKVLDYFTNTVCQDLIIIPATQISPSGCCTPTPEHHQHEAGSE
ncbi:unnamed protein product [Discosporangium mesarthrocarpum]